MKFVKSLLDRILPGVAEGAAHDSIIAGTEGNPIVEAFMRKLQEQLTAADRIKDLPKARKNSKAGKNYGMGLRLLSEDEAVEMNSMHVALMSDKEREAMIEKHGVVANPAFLPHPGEVSRKRKSQGGERVTIETRGKPSKVYAATRVARSVDHRNDNEVLVRHMKRGTFDKDHPLWATAKAAAQARKAAATKVTKKKSVA